MGCFPHSSRLPALQRDVDRAPPIERDKTTADSVRLDSMREIAANKICALVSRSEIRDLVDLRALLEAGVDLKCAGEDTLMKDAGADPATHR
jgi:predicted nucleotidyltransferase component of viral defense system